MRELKAGRRVYSLFAKVLLSSRLTIIRAIAMHCEIDPELKRFIGVLAAFNELGADRALMAQQSMTFLDAYPEHVREIASAIERRDADALEYRLSELANEAQRFQADSLARLTTSIADLDQSHRIESIEARWHDLHSKYAHLARAIERFLRVVCRR